MAVNAEKLVMDWLNADTTIRAEYPAMFDVPAESSATHPIPFVTVEQVGGSDEPFRSLPLIAVQVWGESRWLVSELRRNSYSPASNVSSNCPRSPISTSPGARISPCPTGGPVTKSFSS